MKVLGIDPGLSGGLAILSVSIGRATLEDAVDIPTVGAGTRQKVNVLAFQGWLVKHAVDRAYIEAAQSMPRQGVASTFKYGMACGALEAVVSLTNIPIEFISPNIWKRHMRLKGKDKEISRQRAIELFPNGHDLLARKKDHGRAEAALIAYYGASAQWLGERK